MINQKVLYMIKEIKCHKNLFKKFLIAQYFVYDYEYLMKVYNLSPLKCKDNLSGKHRLSVCPASISTLYECLANNEVNINNLKLIVFKHSVERNNSLNLIYNDVYQI